MNRRRITIFALLALAYVTSGPVLKASQTQVLVTLVAQHYPQVLVQRSLESRGVELRREQCFAVISASPAGAPHAPSTRR